MSVEPVNFDIDLVYLWVNGNDPEWQAKRRKLMSRQSDETAENCTGRYADNDELKYSLRAVAMYAPWINNIYIVTDHQVPAWLDTDNTKIHIVDHSEILPPEALPTFNSTVIEHALYRIPGLSEHFLYSNDDTFINRHVSPDDFFTSDGKPIIRLNRRPFRKLTLFLKEKILHKPLSNYNRTILNASRLVEKHYGFYIGDKTHHNIDAYNRSTYELAHSLFRDEINSVITNHFRDDSDIQRNLYSYVALAENKGVRSYVTQRTSFRFHIDNPSHYKKLEAYSPMLFCLNDSQYARDEDRQRAKTYLRERFPEKSAFER